MNLKRNWLYPVFLSLFLNACGGAGQGQSNSTADTGIGDQFVAFVQQLSATAPETAKPVDVTGVTASAPENADPVN